MEPGDFDDTPAPSAQPSLQLLCSTNKQGQESVSPLDGAASHHHLLKTSVGRHMIVDRNIPVSPVVSRESPPRTPDPSGIGRENQSINLLQNSATPITPPPVRLSRDGGVRLQSPVSERVLLGPSLQHRNTRVNGHRRGSLKSADVDNSKVAAKGQDKPVSSYTDRSSPDSDTSVRYGETHRVSPGGTIHISEVKVKMPRTKGRDRAVKVRPAFNHDPAMADRDARETQAPAHGLGRTKVAPFEPETEGQGAINGEPYATQPSDKPASKVRPSLTLKTDVGPHMPTSPEKLGPQSGGPPQRDISGKVGVLTDNDIDPGRQRSPSVIGTSQNMCMSKVQPYSSSGTPPGAPQQGRF